MLLTKLDNLVMSTEMLMIKDMYNSYIVMILRILLVNLFEAEFLCFLLSPGCVHYASLPGVTDE